MNTFETHHHGPDDDEFPMGSRAGIANSETGLAFEVKTLLDEDTHARFLVKAGAAGGRGRVLRDLISQWVNDGLLYEEHREKVRRERFFGQGQTSGGTRAGGAL